MDDPLYFTDRQPWRAWLNAHFQTAKEVWLLYPKKHTGKPRILYNDAVEEALCFGWIDSINKAFDPDHGMQRFTPRKPKSAFSQPNKERLRWLADHDLIHPSVLPAVQPILSEGFHFPTDIIRLLAQHTQAFEFYRNCTPAYQRIRIAYIDAARKRPEEFEKRLNNFIAKCAEGKLVRGFGGIEKYY
ncbi:MAG: YdeI/OmpD-associated family protein [Bacteroidota bacterium]